MEDSKSERVRLLVWVSLELSGLTTPDTDKLLSMMMAGKHSWLQYPLAFAALGPVRGCGLVRA